MTRTAEQTKPEIISIQKHSPNGRSRRSRAAESQHNATAILEHDAQTLLRRHRLVHRIGVAKVVRHLDAIRLAAGAVLAPDERGLGDRALQLGDHLVARLAGALFVIVAREIVATVDAPMVLEDVLDALAGVLHDGQPGEHRPDAVLLADVIRTGSGDRDGSENE